MNEADKIRKELHNDAWITNEEYGRLVEEADNADERASWADEEDDRPKVPKTVEEMWDCLLELGVSEETLQCMTNFNGYSTDTMEAILYCGTHTGMRSFDQLDFDE